MEQGVASFYEALLNIDRTKAAQIIENCFQKTQSLKTVETVITSALEQIGTNWENGVVSLSQVYMSGIICEQLVEQYFAGQENKKHQDFNIALGVLQDHHTLGKKIVGSVLKSSGFRFFDLGHGLSVDEMVQKTIQHDSKLLLISALMLASALKVREVRDKLDAAGHQVKIITGGAPFRLEPGLWKKVGAHATSKNASGVTKTIKSVMG